MQPDAAIVDLDLAGSDGLQGCRDLRRHSRRSPTHFPIVLVTGRAIRDLESRVNVAGATAIVGKPFSFPSLPQVISERLKKSVLI